MIWNRFFLICFSIQELKNAAMIHHSFFSIHDSLNKKRPPGFGEAAPTDLCAVGRSIDKGMGVC